MAPALPTRPAAQARRWQKAANWLSHLAYDWKARCGGIGWPSCRAGSGSSGTTSEAAGCPIGTSHGSHSMNGWTTRGHRRRRRAGPTPLLGISQGGPSLSPTRCATPNASVTWCCSAPTPKAGASAPAPSNSNCRGPHRDRPPGLGPADQRTGRSSSPASRPTPPKAVAQPDELQQRSTSPDNAWRFVDEFANIDVTDLAPKPPCPR